MPKLRRIPGKYDSLRMIIGGRMELLGLDNTSLAPKWGVCRQTVANWRRDPSVMTLDQLSRLRVALGVTAEEWRQALPM